MSKLKNMTIGGVHALPAKHAKQGVNVTIPLDVALKLGLNKNSTLVFAAVTDNVLQLSAKRPSVLIPVFVDGESFAAQ